MDTDAINVLELELRQIPRVLGVGIEEIDHAVMVHLLASGPGSQTLLLRSASEIVRNHTSGQVVITMSMTPTRPEAAPAGDTERVRLKALERHADDIDVEIARGRQSATGRSSGRGPRAAAVAALAAVGALEVEAPFVLRSALRLVDWLPDREVVVVALTSLVGGPDRVGVGYGREVDEASSLAVLQAVAAGDSMELTPALAPVSQLYD